MPRFSGSGNRVEAPRFFSGPRVQGGDEPANTELAAADADDAFGAFLISYGTIRFSQNFWPDPNVVFNALPRSWSC